MQQFGKLGLMLFVGASLVRCDVAMGEDRVATWMAPKEVAESSDGTEATRPRVRGMLGFGAEGAVEGTFGTDLETHAWIFRAPRGAVVELEVGRPNMSGPGAGASGLLDTDLTVFGPQRVDGGFGDVPIGHDDDSGRGGHAWLEALLLPGGERAGEEATWLAVVGTNEDRGRGTYRLELRCAGGACAAPEAPAMPEACPEGLIGTMRACLDGLPFADLATPWGEGFEGSLAACTGANRVAGWCGTEGTTAAGCADAATREVLSGLCREALRGRLLDDACVLGRTLASGVASGEAVLLIGEDVLDAHSNLTELDRQRLRWAASLTGVAAGDVDLLLSSPGGVLRQVLWDASNREAIEAYTVRQFGQAAGAVFFGGSEAIMAEVRGGALVGCSLKFGPERRRCGAAADCEEGLRCLGVGPKGDDGRCVDSRADTQKERDMPCSSDGECGRETGLVCSGLGLFGHGRCVPAWNRGVFAAEGGQIPDGDLAGLVVELPVSGLVGTLGDLRISLSIEHARLRDLRVTLENADHGGATGWSEVVLFSGERDGEHLVMDRAPVSRLERDVPAAGRWRLRVQDLVTGSTGRLGEVRLEMTAL